jgi:TIR domain
VKPVPAILHVASTGAVRLGYGYKIAHGRRGDAGVSLGEKDETNLPRSLAPNARITRVQIFVSWSGAPAQVLADFLQTWLRQVIQELDPFTSSNSIEKGDRWSPEIARRLNETNHAIECVTSKNQDAPWLNFEAGALAKATDSRVSPLLVDLAPKNVTGPLSAFQLTTATNREDVRRLLATINKHCERPLTTELLNTTFDREWESFEEKIREVSAVVVSDPSPAAEPERLIDDILAEVLERVRLTERLSQQQLSASEALLREMTGTPIRDATGHRSTAARPVALRSAALQRDTPLPSKAFVG